MKKLLFAIIILVMVITGVQAEKAEKQGNISNPVSYSIKYVVASIHISNNTINSTTGASISWNNDAPKNNTVYYGTNKSDVDSFVNGSWSFWDNNTFNPKIRITGLDANKTYYYRGRTVYRDIVENLPTNSFNTTKPGVVVSPAEVMVSESGWMGSPANFRTIKITAAPLDNNGRYITGLTGLVAIIYDSDGVEFDRVQLNGDGPYSNTYTLPDYINEGWYYVMVDGIGDGSGGGDWIAGEFSVLRWSCSSCHSAGGANYPSTFEPAIVHPEHIDTTDIYVEHYGQVITSTTECGNCHSPRPPNWVIHPTSSQCANCHRGGWGCSNCHADRITNQNIFSERYGVDRHSGKDCSDCHGNLTSINNKPACTSCHPIGANITIPESIENKTHTVNKTVACGLCHNNEHDIRSLVPNIETCKNCHSGITHNAGNQCTSCHGGDPHNVTIAGGDACIECHGTGYPGANPMAKTTLVNISAFNESIHQNIYATPSNTTNNNDCWQCHYNKDMNRQNIRGCNYCHRNVELWHGGANITTNLSELSELW